MPNKNILKPTETTPRKSKTESPPSFFTRFFTALSNSITPPPSRKVKVRLINSWQDANFERINAVVHNYLYDESAKWTDLEKVTGLRREQLFYGGTALVTLFLFYGHFVSTLLLLAGIVLPTISSLQALNTADPEQQVYWQRYWVLFGTLTALEHCFLRMFPGSDLSYLKLGLLMTVFGPFYSALTLIFDLINRPFLSVRDKFEQYNYNVVG